MKWAFCLGSSVLYLLFRVWLEVASIFGKLFQLIKHKAVTQLLDKGRAPRLVPWGYEWGLDPCCCFCCNSPTTHFSVWLSFLTETYVSPFDGILSNSFHFMSLLTDNLMAGCKLLSTCFVNLLECRPGCLVHASFCSSRGKRLVSF